MDTAEVIERASMYLAGLEGYAFDVLEVAKPISPEAGLNLAKILSKLSPLVGNLLEFNTVELLNSQREFSGLGKWLRQDPGFPDTIFTGTVTPTPGFELKAWFPLATEITARFKDSQTRFINDNTYLAILAWLPENVIYGKPQIIDVFVTSCLSIARARDMHYHNPPGYVVLEPEDTAARTRNLQQTNTNGLKFQGTREEFEEAKHFVEAWGSTQQPYSTSPNYQKQLRELTSRYKYRLDTNFAKIDRIEHEGIEAFKRQVSGASINGMSVQEWQRLLSSSDTQRAVAALERHLDIRKENVERLLE